MTAKSVLMFTLYTLQDSVKIKIIFMFIFLSNQLTI